MKKFSLLMLLTALFACLSASATDYYLIGGFNNWKEADAAAKFTAKGDGTYELNYSGTLTSGFKINDGTWTNPDANFGSNGSPLVVGTEYICGTGGSSGNITMDGAVNNPKLTFNPTTASLLITGSAGTVTVSYVIHGCLASTEWEATSLTESNGAWTASNVVVSNSAAEFGIKKLENNNQSDWYAAAEAVTVSETTTMTLTNVQAVNIGIAAGTYDFSFNPSTLKLTITKQGGENPPVNPPTPPTEGFKVYFDDFDGWSDGAPHIWAWNDSGNLTTGEWPGPAMTLESGTLYSWSCDETPTGIIITNDQEVKAGGGNINNPQNGATYYRNGTTTKPVTGEVEVKYCLHGNWDGGLNWNDVVLTGNGTLTANNVEVTGAAVEFGVRKLEDSVPTEWYAAATATTVSESTTITLTDIDPVNIGIAAGTYDFSFNPSTLKLTITKQGGENPPVNPPTPGEGFKVYFDDFDGWSDGAPHIWAWNDSGNLTTGEWPGPAMTHEGGTLYSWSCDETPTGIIITNDQEVKAGGGNINNPENGATYYRNGTTTKPVAGEVEVKYCLHGNWDGGLNWEDVVLTGNGTLTAEKVEVTGSGVEFGVRKLEDSVPTEWYAASAATTISDNTTLTLTDIDPVNIGIAAGTYDFSFNPSTLELKVTKNGGSGVVLGETEVEAPVYYNLNGVRIDNVTTGIFIVRQGNKTYKVVK